MTTLCPVCSAHEPIEVVRARVAARLDSLLRGGLNDQALDQIIAAVRGAK